MVVLADRIKHLRKLNHVTQEELSDIIHVSRSAVARFESGYIEPKLKNIIAIADYFDVSIDYLLGRSNECDETITHKLDRIKAILEE